MCVCVCVHKSVCRCVSVCVDVCEDVCVDVCVRPEDDIVYLVASQVLYVIKFGCAYVRYIWRRAFLVGLLQINFEELL